MTTSNDTIMLDVKGLSKTFGSFQAVKDLNFQVKRGEVFGFLGPNGAGKTTTMRIITCFMPPSSGVIKVDGVDTRFDDLSVRRKIGYLPESTPLYNDMLVQEYLHYCGEIRGLKGNVLSQRIDELFAVCGLAKMARRPIGNLSKGYRQRVGLAQALIHNPDLLILDEPTSGLDPNQIIEIRQLIKQIGQSKTVIYCSHILSEVSATCSRIMIINEGSIVASGTADELMSRAGSGNHFSLRVKGPRDGVVAALSAVAKVTTATVRASEGEWLAIDVNAEGKDNIGEELFRCVAQKGWTLSELKRETASLEDVFTQLTRGA
jgi:ABC-2 type transport system ATP-binding protein